ncbi:hypothetical protein V7149_21485, partial [Bacillus sp. JJ1503]|uniref:hypothetical protein n=1 Tax=Bacillus sp. JJ1503 TaxID=3122956 RepID=UPI002FFFB47D
NKVLDENEQMPDGYNDAFLAFVSSYNDVELTEKEEEVIDSLRRLNLEFLKLGIKKIFGDISQDDRADYDKYYSKLENILGNTNLTLSKLDTEFVADSISIQVASKMLEEENKIEKYMTENRVKLTANEVRYNMPNNLDRPFFLEGEVELCDYYNYGFTNETDLFCGRLTPTGGGYSDSWYLYFHRKSFKELYDYIIDGTSADIMVTAEIPSRAYKSGQGNMARVKQMQGK